jgi:hypothetical protein
MNKLAARRCSSTSKCRVYPPSHQEISPELAATLEHHGSIQVGDSQLQREGTR